MELNNNEDEKKSDENNFNLILNSQQYECLNIEKY